MIRVIFEINDTDPKDLSKQVVARVFDELCQTTPKELAVEQDVLNRLGMCVMHQEEDDKGGVIRHLTQRLIVLSEKKIA